MIGVSLSSMMATLGSLYPELKYLGKAAENILQTRQEAPLPYREEAAQLSFFDVIFSHVDFAYEMGVPVLRDVSFSVKPYSGRVIGTDEKQSILGWLRALPLEKYTVLVCDFANWADTAPLPCLVLKK